MLVAYDDEMVDPNKVSFVGKITERIEKASKEGQPYSISIMFKYIVDGVVLSVVRESVDIPHGADIGMQDVLLKPVREYIKTRRKNLIDLVDDFPKR